MKRIHLSRGMFAVVDDADFEMVFSGWSWQADARPHGVFYAKRIVEVGGKRTSQYMHRLLRNAVRVDHKDGDGLNNRRGNLRGCSYSQNLGNQRSDGFKGVFPVAGAHDRWYSKIHHNKKRFYLGSFPSETLAAEAYDVAARILFGRFANLNFGGRK